MSQSPNYLFTIANNRQSDFRKLLISFCWEGDLAEAHLSELVDKWSIKRSKKRY
jgi:hypothetical protein